MRSLHADTVAAGRRKSALTAAELYGGFTNSTLYKNRAPRVFFLKLAKCPARAKSCDTCAVAFSRRRLLVYSTGRRLRNSKKNVADFNFELLIIYQVYCIIIVTREKRFARRGTRATRNPFAQRVCGGSDERRATFRSVCRYELCAVLCGMQVVCLKNYSEALSYGQSKSFQK